MCGIAGIVRAGCPVEPEEIDRMTDAITHRGPDSSGRYIDAGVGLGIRRLEVIDLVTGDQPIGNENGTVWTVLNGEIYNFRELRERLTSRGHTFKTNTDTECIVHAYEEFGDDFVGELRGMFAIALWDSRRRRLLLARDRLGKKPLLYFQRNGALAFASEMQALVTLPELRREVDLGALGDYLAYGYVPAPATIFHAVRKLAPAHVLVWENGAVGVRRYWSLDYLPKLKMNEAEAIAELERRLDEAVRLRLTADVPVGALLSGGVDSSIVVALMARHSMRVKTFSIGFDDAAYNELAHARRVAERYNTDHYEFIVTADAASVLPMLVRHYGEPYADSSAIPTYYVAKIARKHVTVGLNGDGGDEAFGGYDRYRAMQLADTLGALPASSAVLGLGVAAAGAVRRIFPTTSARAARFLGAANLPASDRYASWMSVIKPELLAELVAPTLADDLARSRGRAVEMAFGAASRLGPVDRLLKTDVVTYLPGDLLAKMDIATMANSLEARSPFLDHEVVEFAAALPECLKVGRVGQKRLLKRLARRLIPTENIDRAKMGFGVPVGRWLRGEIRPLAEDALFSPRALKRGYFREESVRRLWDEHQNGRADRTLPLWTLLMLELWHREFLP